MRGLIIPVILVGLLAIGSMVPTSQHTVGSIRSIDSETRTLTLDNGSIFSLRKRIDEDALAVGERVRISFGAKTALNTAHAVKVIE